MSDDDGFFGFIFGFFKFIFFVWFFGGLLTFAGVIVFGMLAVYNDSKIKQQNSPPYVENRIWLKDCSYIAPDWHINPDGTTYTTRHCREWYKDTNGNTVYR